MLTIIKKWFLTTKLPMVVIVLFTLPILVSAVSMIIFQMFGSSFMGYNLRVLPDGTLQYQRYTEGGYDIFDLEMNPLGFVSHQNTDSIDFVYLNRDVYDWQGSFWRKWQRGTVINDQGVTKWYMLKDDGYFERYDVVTRTLTGYLGRNGIVTRRADLVPFGRIIKYEQDWKDREDHYLLTEEGLYIFSLDREFFAERIGFNGSKVHDFVRLKIPMPEVDDMDREWVYLAILHEDHIAIHNRDGEFVLSLPSTITEEHQHTQTVGIGNDDIFYLMTHQIEAGNWQVTAYDKTGQQLSERVVPRPVTEDGLPAPFRFIASQPGTIAIATAVAYFMIECEHADDPDHECGKMPWEGARAAGEWVSAIVVTLCVALLVALGIYWFHLRYQPIGRKERWTWFTALFLFPYIAIIVYVTVPKWIPLVRCAKCGRKRPLTENQCRWCAAPFPQRELIGIELIESA